MVYEALDRNGNRVTASSLSTSEKVKGTTFNCIDNNCGINLMFIDEHFRNGDVLITGHFRHKSSSTCFVSKFYKDPNNKVFNDKFYDDWISLCKQTNKTCHFEDRGNETICIDIISNEGQYIVRSNMTNHKMVKMMEKQAIENIILSGITRPNKLYCVGDKYYINFSKANDVMSYNGAPINVFIDNNADKMIKLVRDKNRMFTKSRYGLEVELIDINKFLDQFCVARQCDKIQDVHNIELWNNDRNAHSLNDPIKLAAYKQPQKGDNISIESDTYIFNDNTFNVHPIGGGSALFIDNNIMLGMKRYLKYHDLTKVQLGELEERITIAKENHKDSENCIQNGLSILISSSAAADENSISIKKILFSLSSVVPIRGFRNESHIGVDKILLCWYIMTFIEREIGYTKIDKCLRKYKLNTNRYNLDEMPFTEHNIFDLCRLLPFDVVDRYYLNKLDGSKVNHLRIKSGLSQIEDTAQYYVSEDYLRYTIKDVFDLELEDISEYFVKHNVYFFESNDWRDVYISKVYANYEDTIKIFLNNYNVSDHFFSDYSFVPPHSDYSSIFSQNNSEPTNKVSLNDKQKDALSMMEGNNLGILTGGGGTGKTTVIIELIKKLMSKNVKVSVLSPTGTAGQNIRDDDKFQSVYRKGATVQTIDKFIVISKNKLGEDNEESKYEYKTHVGASHHAIIIDEFSMVSIQKFYKLVKILNKMKAFYKLLIVGDSHQIPPINVGHTLKHLLRYSQYELSRFRDNEDGSEFEIYEYDKSTKIIPTVKLVINNRLTNTESYIGKIIRSVRNIKKEEVDDVVNMIISPSQSDGTYEYIPHISEFYNFIKEKAKSIHNVEDIISYMKDIIILVPKEGGNFGYNRVNKEISNIICRKLHSFKDNNGLRFKTGDRITCTENGKYNEIALNNGDIFFVVKIWYDTRYKTNVFTIKSAVNSNLVLSISGKDVYKFELAWAITIHRSQGKQWEHVILPISIEFNNMYTLNLLYTGISRCRSKLSIYCCIQGLIKAALTNTVQSKLPLLELHNQFHA